MGLRCAEHQPSADLRDRLGDGEPAPEEVDPSDPQGGHLAEAQSGIRQQPDDAPVLTRRVGEPLDLVMGEEPRLLPRHSGQGYALGRVPRDTAVADSEVQEQREHAVRLANGPRGRPPRQQLRRPHRDVGVSDVGEPVLTPCWEDVRPQQIAVPIPRARLHAGL
ncbi:hypothetical protein A6V29_18555 [Blastococcus sp. CCUG 61487]|nr:hypothetical protein A6V29_18555 [Blastococcus sp. CCUG 61487]